jgi:dGTPase
MKIAAKKTDPEMRLFPMTMEGCVMRIADTISYIGRDIEDAIRLDIIKRSDLPDTCVKRLGNTNGTVVYRLVTDLIRNSYQKNCITFSSEIADTLKSLKAFSYENIYLNPKIKKQSDMIRDLFEILFHRYLADLKKEKYDSIIFQGFLKDMSEKYLQTHCHAEIVRDFIAGMTDSYFLHQFPDHIKTQLKIR